MSPACNLKTSKLTNQILLSLFSSLGTLESLSGWKTQVVRRTGGLTQGTENRKLTSALSAVILYL